MNAAEKLAKIDGWEMSVTPIHGAIVWTKAHSHNLPDYNDPGVMLAMLERKSKMGYKHTYDTRTKLHTVDIDDGFNGKHYSKFVKAAQQALLKANE